jgi:hypothetical protein
MLEATNAQIMEVFDLIQEECSEIIQIISKIRRFGFQSYHPDDPEKRSNHQLLNDEVGDFETLKNYLVEANILDPIHLAQRIKFKKEKLRKYSHIYDKESK